MILLIYPKHSPFPHSVSAPLSIFSLGGYLEQRGEGVEYFDERLQGWDYLDSLLKKDPLLVGVSVMTSYQIKRAISIASYIKSNYPRLPLVWGGIHPTASPEETMESNLADFVIKGEGEGALYELSRILTSSQRNDFSQVKNLAWRNNGRVIQNDNREFLDINTLPFVYKGKAADMFKLYQEPNSGREGVAMETSRGCGYSCGFCYNHFFNRSVCRAKSKEKLEEEFLGLKRMGVENILFVDDNLGVSRQHVKDLCLLTQKYGMRWSGGMRTDIIDEELVGLLERGGCRSLFFGIESVNPQTLKYLNKSIDLEKTSNTIRWISKTNIVPVYSFMTGLPGDDKNSLKGQFEFVDFIRGVDRRAEIAIQPYNPLPGTLLYESAVKQGFNPPKRLDGWWRMTTGETLGPWVKNKAVLKNLYLISFLAFRGSRFLNNIVFFPFSILARLRWKFKFFNLCIERVFYILLIRIWILSDELLISWFLLKKGVRICHRNSTQLRLDRRWCLLP
jgi:anaerobic magnesium-protoporphyrin IX monomethyl ester cyclase